MNENAPADDEIEVSLFGPGKGEGCALHLGNGDWIVVDSCVDQRASRNPILAYFERIGVNVAEQVRLVVATHAHDDHFAGIADIFDAATDAFLVLPQALTKVEFVTLILADEKLNSSLSERAYQEYGRLLTTVRARGAEKRDLKPLRLAGEGRDLFVDGNRRVRSLSPSDEAMSRAAASIAQSITGRNEGGVSRLDVNEVSVALWVDALGKSILLGADLTVGPAQCGWRAVVASFDPRESQASVVKVPHHGAPNAHLPDMWSQLVAPDAIALIAPYRPGRNPRPAPEDLTRVSEVAGSVYLTALTRDPVPARSSRRSISSIRTLATDVRDPWGSAGHVRARCLRDQPWQVDVTPPARRH